MRYSVQHGAPAVSALMQYGAGDYFTVQLLGVRGIFLAETSGLSRQGRAGGSQVSQRTNHTNTYRHEHMQNRTCLKTCAFVFACACTQNLTSREIWPSRPAFRRFLEAVKHVENEKGYYVEKRQVPTELAATSDVCFPPRSVPCLASNQGRGGFLTRDA